jgi:hypothetical protein
MQNQETVLHLPNHSQELAEIDSRPPRPSGGGGSSRGKTRIRRVRWEEGTKEKALELRNEFWYMPLEEFRQVRLIVTVFADVVAIIMTDANPPAAILR